MVSARTELAQINRHLHRYQSDHGEVVLWYELDAHVSRYHDVFNIHGKVYREPVAVPALWVISTEDTQESVAEGRRNLGTLQLAITVYQFRQSGISDPYDYERHLNDMVVYQGEYFSVGEYSLLGRMARNDVIIAVNALRIYPEEELTASEIPDAAYVAESTRPSLGAGSAPGYVHYPPPAPQAVCSGTISGGYSWSTPGSEAGNYGAGPFGSGPYGGQP